MEENKPKGPGVWRAEAHDRDRTRGRLRSYLHHTAGPLTGFLMGFPLALIYAVGSALRGPRAAGDFLTELQFDVLGATGYLLLQSGLVVAFLVVILVLQRKRRFEWRYFGPLIAESTLYAFLVGALLYALEAALGIQPHHSIHPTREAALLAAVGEAVNEETFFRWILLPALLWLLGKVGLARPWARGLAGLALGSLIYAIIAYFTGSGMGDTRTAQGFLTFLTVGVVFNGLFLLRGYTVVAYTHLLYAIYWAFATPLLA
jgi:hypothetical protein